MTTHPLEARRWGAAACVTKKLPFAVAPKAASQSASVSSSAGFGTKPSPAALTSRSRPPSFAAARSTSARASSTFARSPSARPAATTDQPSASSRAAIAPPTRPVPPVTRAECNFRPGEASSFGNEDFRRNCRRGRPCGGGYRRCPGAHTHCHADRRRLREGLHAERGALHAQGESDGEGRCDRVRHDLVQDGWNREDERD